MARRDDQRPAAKRPARPDDPSPAPRAASRPRSDSPPFEQPAVDEERTRPPPPVAPEALPLEHASLFIESGPGAGRSIPFPEGDLSAGRSSANKLKLAHPSVSRRHAVLQRRGNNYSVRDLGSHNGTFVNGRRVQGVCELNPGDEVAIGLVVMILRSAGRSDLRSSGFGGGTNVSLVHRTGFKFGLFGGTVVLGVIVALIVTYRHSFSGDAAEEPAPSAAATPAEPAAAPPAAAAAATPPQAPAEAPAAAPAPGPPPPAAEPAREQEARGDTSPVEDKPRQAPAPEPAPATPSRRVATAKPARNESVRRTAPARRSSRDRAAEAREHYLEGDLDLAISVAAAAGESALAGRFAALKKEVSSAKADLNFQETDSAIRRFQNALALDRELSRGRGSIISANIRSDLAKIYYARAARSAEAGQSEEALVHVERALKNDPSNQKARDLKRRLLRRTSGGEQKDARQAADEAFGDP